MRAEEAWPRRRRPGGAKVAASFGRARRASEPARPRPRAARVRVSVCSRLRRRALDLAPLPATPAPAAEGEGGAVGAVPGVAGPRGRAGATGRAADVSGAVAARTPPAQRSRDPTARARWRSRRPVSRRSSPRRKEVPEGNVSRGCNKTAPTRAPSAPLPPCGSLGVSWSSRSSAGKAPKKPQQHGHGVSSVPTSMVLPPGETWMHRGHRRRAWA
ncbi:PREDICTED: translation initiation factor IF-2-like [Chinchilla lanigera]|uniref:translation initiation factor IF-2-like n=1 Tax=Chinchilla lanigera TaxID=34839 RepID=UPI000696C699|nr:PREDICTED: translation initiation factor IF-2-like [Chinchilla lanigera]